MDASTEHIKIHETPVAVFYKVNDIDSPFFINHLREYPNKWSINPITNGNMARQFFKIYNNEQPFILVIRKDKKQIYCAMLTSANILMLFYDGTFTFKEMNRELNISKQEFIELFKK